MNNSEETIKHNDFEEFKHKVNCNWGRQVVPSHLPPVAAINLNNVNLFLNHTDFP